MKRNNPARRPIYVAAALGAILLTAGCAGTPDPMFANRPANLDGGVGQLLRYCSKFQNSGDLVTAAGLCERAHKLEPGNPAPLMQLADILVAMRRPEHAISAYRMIVDGAPDHVEARYALGKLYINLEQYDLAAAEFRAALRYKGRDPRLHNALGVAHGLVGAHDSALQSFEAGLKIAPKHISLRNNLGLSLVLNGRYDEGIKVLEAVAADPGANETSYQNLQLAYGMISTANAGQAIPEAASAHADTTRDPVMTAELRAAPAGEQPLPRPEDRTARSAAVLRPIEIQAEDATPGTPVPLIQEAQWEEAVERDSDIETPIEVTVFDTPAFDALASGGEAPAGSADETRPARRSPLRMQTARAATTDLEDSGAPSAVMGNYLTAEASIDEAPAAPGAPAAPEHEVAAVQPTATPQPIAAARTETGTARRYTVQLASYLSEGRAMRGWTELLAAAPDLLGSLEPVVRRADLGEDRGTFYRLRTAPTTKGDANTLCTELKTRGIDCLVIKEAPAAVDGGSQTG
ncbi:MAG: tetratricopeptide repeat protein [Proteobacteria bacterium]|nr:tetratricopeptide repeat protein [Pseudomonadota bacterium]